MKRVFVRRKLSDALFLRNWESGIKNVSVEPCDKNEDPLGYRAVFSVDRERMGPETFVIGASLLAQREMNLSKVGYKAPMTQRAIDMVEAQLGRSLPVVLA